MNKIGVPKRRWIELDDWLQENPGMAAALKVIGGPRKGCAWMRLETVDDGLACLLQMKFGRDGWD